MKDRRWKDVCRKAFWKDVLSARNVEPDKKHPQISRTLFVTKKWVGINPSVSRIGKHHLISSDLNTYPSYFFRNHRLLPRNSESMGTTARLIREYKQPSGIDTGLSGAPAASLETSPRSRFFQRRFVSSVSPATPCFLVLTFNSAARSWHYFIVAPTFHAPIAPSSLLSHRHV